MNQPIGVILTLNQEWGQNDYNKAMKHADFNYIMVINAGKVVW